jgi:MYXO-CTERM domain-containing protein
MVAADADFAAGGAQAASAAEEGVTSPPRLAHERRQSCRNRSAATGTDRVTKGEMRTTCILRWLTTWTPVATVLVALASSSCTVEESVSPPLRPPELEPQAPDDAAPTCPLPPNFCDGHEPETCCSKLDLSGCVFKQCTKANQVCIQASCYEKCESDVECPPTLADGERVCREGACFSKGCTSNRDCDAGDVCGGSENGAPTCRAANQEGADPGCSTPYAGAPGAVASFTLVALALAAARARRRRSE